MKKLKSFVLLAILAVSVLVGCFSVCSVVADHNPTWWDYDWNQRLEYTVNSSLVDEDLTNFPVLIYINESVVDWGDIQNDLNDIRFTGDYLDELDFEIDSFVLNSEAWFWVRLPEVSSSVDTYFFMYYDNKFCDSGENAEAVWDSDFVMVQHMNDETTSTTLDSTSNDNDGTKTGANEPLEVDGLVAKAQQHDGVDDKITISSAPTAGYLAVSVTYKTSNITISNSGILCQGVTSGTTQFTWFKQDINPWQVYFYNPDDGKTYRFVNMEPDGDDEWHTDVFVFLKATDQLLWYRDGSLFATKNSDYNTDCTPSSTIYIGYRSAYIPVTVDEVRILDTILPATWVGASYYAQSLELVYEGYHTGVEYARRGEVVAAALIASFILIPLLIIGIFAAKRKW